MTKFHKFQKISSVVPFWSTLFVLIVTMVELKRHSASRKLWGSFILTFFITGTIVYFVNAVIMTGQHLTLNVIVSWLILTIANILFVDFQIMSIQSSPANITLNIKAYVIISGIIVALLGVGMLLFTLFTPWVSIEDTNGAYDNSLVTIGLDEIISSPDNYSALSSYTSYDGPSTNIVGTMKDYDYQECAFSCQKISGIMTLHATKTNKNKLSLDFFSQLESGNMEIVVIVDGEYYDSIPINQNSSIVLSDIANKTVVIRIGAESAKMKITVKRICD